MSWPILIKNGHIVDPATGWDSVGSILLEDGKVAWRDKAAQAPASNYEELDATGLVVCPGFIDLHCHLREPGYEDQETIYTGTRAAARGGFTTVCCMPNTDPPLDSPAPVALVKDIISRDSIIRVLPIGCITRSRQGKTIVEMDRLAAAGVIGFSDDGAPVSDNYLMYQAMRYAEEVGLPIIEHSEDLAIGSGGQINEGIISARLGLAGLPQVAEEVAIARNLLLARATGARLHLAHISTAGSVELVRRAKEIGVNVSAEVTPHHLTLTEEWVLGYNTMAKVKPPLRTWNDIEALLQGLEDGVIDAIATDHAPHTATEKQCEFAQAAFGISGLETALGSLMSLVHKQKLSLLLMVDKLTRGPAAVIGDKYPGLGTLAPGAPADVTILDPEREWVVSAASFCSKGKNTPLEGEHFKGVVVATIYQGEEVYQDDSVQFKGRAK